MIKCQYEILFQLQYNKESCTIVCGMPEVIKNKHAYYLGRVAMKLMGSLTEFRFRHIDDNLMRFKVAIHSG